MNFYFFVTIKSKTVQALFSLTRVGCEKYEFTQGASL